MTVLTQQRPVSPAPLPADPRDVVEIRPMWEQVAFYLFLVLPFLALIGGIVWASLGGGISWLTAVLAVAFYVPTALGITVGYHRLLTHGAFKAPRWLRVALTVLGSMAVQGPVIRWVADHRKHHKFADAPGDPHSPWRFGTSKRALLKGLWWAHTGWLFDREKTPKQRYAPDLCADRDLARLHRQFPMWVAVSMLAPAVIALAVTQSWAAAGSALLWAGLIRISLLHHVTWSINSICHAVGRRPFRTRDRSTNVWPLALLSMGESWHNLHHAEPTSARHGVRRGEIDASARLIAIFERLGWARDVRWPQERRLAERRV